MNGRKNIPSRPVELDSIHKTFYSSGKMNGRKNIPSRPVELKRKKSQIPPPQKVVISEEEISRRWQVIREQEKQRKSSHTDEAKTRSSPDLRDCTLIYEVNGIQIGSKSSQKDP